MLLQNFFKKWNYVINLLAIKTTQDIQKQNIEDIKHLIVVRIPAAFIISYFIHAKENDYGDEGEQHLTRKYKK